MKIHNLYKTSCISLQDVKSKTADLPADVLTSEIRSVRRYRDFHRIEARVTLVMRPAAQAPAQRYTFLVSAPIAMREQGATRRELIDAAQRLALVAIRDSAQSHGIRNAA
ncbi:hypothetical protein [Puniceibacterium confluentis]|uniref:hypothetical protein n=1 Tax=Puniceibacterium confluentis TaxID=1958944 RepID=UPI003561689C